jgi:hypothetical protein
MVIIHANTRIPMPISTKEYLQRCDNFINRYGAQLSG